jgi:ubiquinol-cytochrome c reductase subunit 10
MKFSQALRSAASPFHPGHPAGASKYGPRIFHQTTVAGFTPKQFVGLGLRLGAFGGSVLLAVVFFASGIPRLQDDILKKIPGMARVYEKTIHPADNPF